MLTIYIIVSCIVISAFFFFFFYRSPEYDLVTTEANTKEEESLWFPKPKSTEHLNSTSVRHEVI